MSVHDELPEGVGFVDFTSTGTATCDETDGVIDCTIATLAPGESVVIVVNVTGDVPGRVVNEVTVQADQKDINRDNNRDTEETLIDPADLELEKTVDRSTVSLWRYRYLYTYYYQSWAGHGDRCHGGRRTAEWLTAHQSHACSRFL